MTLYVDRPAQENGDMKRLQARLLEWLDRTTANGAEWPGLQGVTFTVTGFAPEDGSEDTFSVRFDNHAIIGAP